MIVLAYILSGFSLLMSVPLLIQLKVTKSGLILWSFKLVAGALSPYWAMLGIVGAVIGGVFDAVLAVPMGLFTAAMMTIYVWRCTRDHKEFENVFGAGWEDKLNPQQTEQMVKRRWSLLMRIKTSPEPSFEKDVAFWTFLDTKRELLCDIWQPGDGNASGLAFIYFHGSGWYIGDKGFNTRPFLQHLAAQGHTVMDVAYRLFPETDMYGMIGDTKRAVAWMKTNASSYGVNPRKIVLGGGSAGAHLALMAAYAPEHPEFTPDELKSTDLSVCGVISYYGPTDLVAFYNQTGQQRARQQGAGYFPPMSTDPDAPKDMRNAGRLDILLGGHPEEVPGIYQLFSTTTYIHADCPPSMLIQGSHDRSVPVDATRAFYKQLNQSGVPAINIEYPWTDHGFDLLLPQINPAFQSALYDVDRFLALLANKH